MLIGIFQNSEFRKMSVDFLMQQIILLSNIFGETPVKYIPLLKDLSKQLANIVNYQMYLYGISQVYSCLALEIFLTEHVLTGK